MNPFSYNRLYMMLLPIFLCSVSASVDAREQEKYHLEKIEKTQYQELLATKPGFSNEPQLKVIRDYDEMRQLLGDRLRNEKCDGWSNDDERCLGVFNEQGERVGEQLPFIECGFEAYYPEENRMHLDCGHSYQFLTSIITREEIEEEPLLRQYSLDHQYRFTGHYNGQSQNYFVQINVDGEWQYHQNFPLLFGEAKEQVWLYGMDKFTWLNETDFVLYLETNGVSPEEFGYRPEQFYFGSFKPNHPKEKL